MEDRKIRCHKVGGHGGETFLQGMMNSCNPVLIDVGQRLGPERYYQYFKQFGLLGKTGIDLPGEAGTIMHQPDQIGPVELATVSFGQSFQITPIQLITTASSLINGGTRITPHIGIRAVRADGQAVHVFALQHMIRAAAHNDAVPLLRQLQNDLALHIVQNVLDE